MRSPPLNLGNTSMAEVQRLEPSRHGLLRWPTSRHSPGLLGTDHPRLCPWGPFVDDHGHNPPHENHGIKLLLRSTCATPKGQTSGQSRLQSCVEIGHPEPIAVVFALNIINAEHRQPKVASRSINHVPELVYDNGVLQEGFEIVKPQSQAVLWSLDKCSSSSRSLSRTSGRPKSGSTADPNRTTALARLENLVTWSVCERHHSTLRKGGERLQEGSRSFFLFYSILFKQKAQ
jgi:hypothetical protein